MSVFTDKTYQGMDWLSQAVEPIHNPLNDFLAAMPDEFIVPREMIFASLTSRWDKGLSRDSVVSAIYANMGEKANRLTWEDRRELEQCFALEIADGPVTITGTGITGQIKLIKKVNILDDSVAKRMMARASYVSVNHRDCQPGAIIQLGTILFEGFEKEMKDFNEATSKGKLALIMSYVANSADKDVFKIRSVVAYENFVKNINQFLTTSSDKCLGRIFKVITMARHDQPTYSVEV